MNKSEAEPTSENASHQELDDWEKLGNLFDQNTQPTWEKLQNYPKYIRRQEVGYLIAYYDLFKQVLNVKGSIVYMGVYQGAGFMTHAHLSAALEPYNHTRRIIGFDTFEGYPDIQAEDQTHGKDFKTLKPGGFPARGAYEELQAVTELYDANRALGHIPKIEIIKGDIMETLPKYVEENQHLVVSMVILTVNLYNPTKLALELLYPKMPKGAIVVILSLNELFYPGATRAFFEVVGESGPMINTFPHAPNLAYHIKP